MSTLVSYCLPIRTSGAEEKLRNTEVEKLIFSEALIITKNQKNKQKSITSFFG